MRRAIALAARGLGTTSPNPVVGCVLLDAAGEVVGEGFHAYAGGPHAEIVALAQAGERARGGTAVVTLEPCNHTGRTGPCAQALIDAGVRRVVIAVADPNPVAAGGAATLRGAGRRGGDRGARASEAEAGNIAWLTAVRRGRPYVIWKFAATLDGRSAAADGTSMWITSRGGPDRRARAARHVDAIIVGVGTVLADDPQLTVRDLRDGTLADPAAAAGGGRLVRAYPADARVRDGAAPTWIATAAEVGAGPDGRVDLHALLAALYARGVRARAAGGRPDAGRRVPRRRPGRPGRRLRRARSCSAPARRRSLDAGVTTIADAIDLDFTDVTRIGPDLRFTASCGRSHPTAATEERRSCDVHRHRRGTRRGRRPHRRRRRLGAVIAVRGPLVTSDARHGDSIAVNGVCLTVVDDADGVLHRRRDGRDAAPLLARRAARRRPGQPGARRHARQPARRPPRAGPRRRGRRDRRPRARRRSGRCVRFSLPAELARYVVEKGSITVDGVSLTVGGGRRRRRSRSG